MLLVIYMTFHLKINFLMLPVTYVSCRLVIIFFHFIFKLKGMPITVQSALEAVKSGCYLYMFSVLILLEKYFPVNFSLNLLLYIGIERSCHYKHFFGQLL